MHPRRYSPLSRPRLLVLAFGLVLALSVVLVPVASADSGHGDGEDGSAPRLQNVVITSMNADGTFTGSAELVNVDSAATTAELTWKLEGKEKPVTVGRCLPPDPRDGNQPWTCTFTIPAPETTASWGTLHAKPNEGNTAKPYELKLVPPDGNIPEVPYAAILPLLLLGGLFGVRTLRRSDSQAA